MSLFAIYLFNMLSHSMLIYYLTSSNLKTIGWISTEFNSGKPQKLTAICWRVLVNNIRSLCYLRM